MQKLPDLIWESRYSTDCLQATRRLTCRHTQQPVSHGLTQRHWTCCRRDRPPALIICVCLFVSVVEGSRRTRPDTSRLGGICGRTDRHKTWANCADRRESCANRRLVGRWKKEGGGSFHLGHDPPELGKQASDWFGACGHAQTFVATSSERTTRTFFLIAGGGNVNNRHWGWDRVSRLETLQADNQPLGSHCCYIWSVK